MKFSSVSSCAVALISFIVTVEAAVLGHSHGHNHLHQPRNEVVTVEKRGGQCQFPADAGLVAVTPDAMNAGWAMSPDQSCTPGHYCPYACPPGQVSMQWDPDATSYSYPMSMVCWFLPCGAENVLTFGRMVVSTAITTGKLKSHSLTSLIARTGRVSCLPSTSAMAMSPFVRPCSLGTRLC